MRTWWGTATLAENQPKRDSILVDVRLSNLGLAYVFGRIILKRLRRAMSRLIGKTQGQEGPTEAVRQEGDPR